MYSRIGGDATLEAAVTIFYDKILADERIRHFFDGVDMDAQRAKQKSFLAYVLGGPVIYTGKEIRAAHQHLDVNEEHYRAFEEHLASTLRELHVVEPLINDVVAIASRHHDDVLDL